MASEPGRVLLAPKMQNVDLPVAVRDALSALFHHVDSAPTSMTSHAADADGYKVGLITGDTLSLLAEPKPQRWKLDDLVPIAVLTVQNSGFFAQPGGA